MLDFRTIYGGEEPSRNRAAVSAILKIQSLYCIQYVSVDIYRLEIQSVMLVFSTGFVNYCPFNLLSG